MLTGATAPASALEAVASTALVDARWRNVRDLRFALRNDGTESILAAFGAFADVDLARLTSLSSQIERAAGRARYIDYHQAERDCEILAAQLKERYGHRELRRFSYYPVPRGGLIVYGMLSYALDLPANANDPSAAGDAPKVIVDDCAISGLRFGQMLKSFPKSRILFTSLYSHPDLRRAVCDREVRVLDFVSANDLTDLAPQIYGDGYGEWHANWSSRLGDEVYWTGQPEYLCFAWSEPETSFWNSATGKLEPGWTLVPRKRCLKGRSADAEPRKDADGEKSAPVVQVLPRFPGPVRPAEGVLYAHMNDESIAVAAYPESECFLLEGTAADMWRALLEYGAVKAAATVLAGRYDIEPQRLETDMQKFLEELREKGLVSG